MTWLIVCRFFMGPGLGAEIVVGYGSVGEFIPPAVRGKWSAYLSLITNSALFFSTFIGYLIIPSIGWRGEAKRSPKRAPMCCSSNRRKRWKSWRRSHARSIHRCS
jgi:MFS family permease